MTEEIQNEETLETPIEEVPQEPTQIQSPGNFDQKFNQLFGRLERIEKRIRKSETPVEPTPQPVSNSPKDEYEKIAEATAAFDGLDASERSKLIRESKMMGKDLLETRKSEDFNLWKKAYREKVELENTPLPSTKQSETQKALDDMTNAEKVAYFKTLPALEKEKIYTELGFLSKSGRPPVPKRFGE
jgi:hypothetical protein